MIEGRHNTGKKFNRLKNEKSPYLRQHAQNPVDWYPWGEEPFQKARRENKPVLLSIGYSACHWCHVMAHESFENQAIAEIMNHNFVCIKVDREEYPDVDHIYQMFVQITTGRGGWPLTVFLTPDKLPFYGGTYYPATSRYGIIGFPDLLQRINQIYHNEPEKIQKSTSQIEIYLKKLDKSGTNGELPEMPRSFDQVYRTMEKSFDPEHGGFGPAPKFPHVPDMNFLLAWYHYTGEKKAREMVLHTLKKMAEGGIYDQIGGGFHRYSTDEKWLVPHFEKMLYDNALLIPLYVDAFRLTGDEFFRRIARETTDFVLRELRDSGGAFYATLDADSEGEEGKYYVWEYREIQEALPEPGAGVFRDFYDITPGGNFEGKNILHVPRSLETLTDKTGQAEKSIQQGRKLLLDIRRRRVPPGLDDKILTDWNGMMVSALWKVYQITGDAGYRKAAEDAIGYLRKNLLDDNSVVYHFVKHRREKIPGYLDDYAWVIQAFIDGFETTQDYGYLEAAVSLTGKVNDQFWDEDAGSFYFTDRSVSAIIVRQRQTFDASTPAGNSVMGLNLLRLHAYTGREQYQKTAEIMFRGLKNEIENQGTGLTTLVTGLLWYYFRPVEVVVSTSSAKYPAEMFDSVQKMFVPYKIMIWNHDGLSDNLIDPTLIKDRNSSGDPAIYICHKMTCSLPQIDPDHLFKVFKELNLHIR